MCGDSCCKCSRLGTADQAFDRLADDMNSRAKEEEIVSRKVVCTKRSFSDSPTIGTDAIVNLYKEANIHVHKRSRTKADSNGRKSGTVESIC